jgi:hydroxymethylglutaryl-CoA lyase
MQEALDAGLKRVAVFTTVSETFSQKNTNCSVTESLERINRVVQMAKEKQVEVRAYVSCVVGCPYEGKMDPGRVRSLTRTLWDFGCYEVSLGDTIGIATPKDIRELIKGFSDAERKRLAGHFHDTFGMAIANVLASVEMGLQTVDTSVAGLGGCPYAPGAAGNVATEEVVYLLHGLGEDTGVDLSKLLAAGEFISSIIQRQPSKLAHAFRNRK